MKVSIKSFDVKMEIKNKGVEFEVRDSKGTKHIGDCVVNKKGLIWCPGKTLPANGKQVDWNKFIKLIQSD